MIRITPLTIVLLLVGCGRPMYFEPWQNLVVPAVQTTGGARTATDDDTFSCYLRFLPQMQYRVEESDRGSGFIRSVKKDGAGEYANEATVVVAPADTGGGSTVSVAVRRIWVTTSSGRSGDEMTMTGAAQADLEYLSVACM